MSNKPRKLKRIVCGSTESLRILERANVESASSGSGSSGCDVTRTINQYATPCAVMNDYMRAIDVRRSSNWKTATARRNALIRKSRC